MRRSSVVERHAVNVKRASSNLADAEAELRSGAGVAQRSHEPFVVGSSPTSAIWKVVQSGRTGGFCPQRVSGPGTPGLSAKAAELQGVVVGAWVQIPLFL